MLINIHSIIQELQAKNALIDRMREQMSAITSMLTGSTGASAAAAAVAANGLAGGNYYYHYDYYY